MINIQDSAANDYNDEFLEKVLPDLIKESSLRLFEKYIMYVERVGASRLKIIIQNKTEFVSQDTFELLLNYSISKHSSIRDKTIIIENVVFQFENFINSFYIKFGTINNFIYYGKKLVRDVLERIKKNLNLNREPVGYYITVPTNIIRYHLFQGDDVSKLRKLHTSKGILDRFLFVEHRGAGLIADFILFLHHSIREKIIFDKKNNNWKDSDPRNQNKDLYMQYLSDVYVDVFKRDSKDLEINSDTYLKKSNIFNDRVGSKHEHKNKKIVFTGQTAPYWKLHSSSGIPYPAEAPSHWDNNTPDDVKEHFKKDLIQADVKQLNVILNSLIEGYRTYTSIKDKHTEKESYNLKLTRFDERELNRATRELENKLKQFILYSSINGILLKSEKTIDGRDGFELTPEQIIGNLYFPHQSIQNRNGTGLYIGTQLTLLFVPKNERRDKLYNKTLEIIDSLVEQDLVYMQFVQSKKTNKGIQLKGRLYKRTKPQVKSLLPKQKQIVPKQIQLQLEQPITFKSYDDMTDDEIERLFNNG